MFRDYAFFPSLHQNEIVFASVYEVTGTVLGARGGVNIEQDKVYKYVSVGSGGMQLSSRDGQMLTVVVQQYKTTQYTTELQGGCQGL